MQLHGEVPTHRMDVGDSSCSTVLEMELPDGADLRQGSGHREGSNMPRQADGPSGVSFLLMD